MTKNIENKNLQALAAPKNKALHSRALFEIDDRPRESFKPEVLAQIPWR